MELKASKYPDTISLAQGVPSFDTPQFIKRRVEKELKNEVMSRYSLAPGLAELRELFEIYLAKENMFYDWETEIIVTAGAIEALTATIMAITSPGDEIIIPEPAYTSYREVIVLAGCRPKYVPLHEDDWTLEVKNIEEAISPTTKAILFSNPNNPTGTVFSKSQLLELAELVKKHNIFVITDELYKDFVFEKEFLGGDRLFSLAEIPEIREKIIRVFSLSKLFAMTGWRIGFLHSDAKVVKEILKVHDCLVTCAPVISQFAAMGALEGCEDNITNFNVEFKKRRDLICARFDKLKKYFSYVTPRGAYYIFPRIITEAFPNAKKVKNEKGREVVDSWEFCCDMLDKVKVATVPGFAFGPSGEGHFRLNFARSEKDINAALDRIEKYCKDYGIE
jgi:aminotransferase